MNTNRKILLIVGIVILIIAIFFKEHKENFKNDVETVIQDAEKIKIELEKLGKINNGDLIPLVPIDNTNENKPNHHHKKPNHPHHKPNHPHKHEIVPEPSEPKCQKYASMDKYILKTAIPSCTNDFITKRAKGKYIKKTKIPGCPRVPNQDKYILKTSIQPDNKTKHKKKHRLDSILRNKIINSVIDNKNYSKRHRATGHSNHLQQSGLLPYSKCKFTDHSIIKSNIFNKI